MASWDFLAFWESFLSKWVFMLHVPLHIKSVIDVNGVYLWVSSVCWDPLWDILASGVAVYYIKVYKAGKTRYTRRLSQQRWGHTRHSPEQGTSISDCLVTHGRRPCASLSWLTWPVTWMTLAWQFTRMTGKPSFAGRKRYTILISHIQHKTIYFFQK